MTLELSKATLDSRTKGKQNWKVKRWIQAHISAKICTFTAKIWWDEKEKTIMCFSFAPWKLSVTAFRTWSKTHISEILYSMQRFQFLTLLKLKKKKQLRTWNILSWEFFKKKKRILQPIILWGKVHLQEGCFSPASPTLTSRTAWDTSSPHSRSLASRSSPRTFTLESALLCLHVPSLQSWNSGRCGLWY